MQQDQGQLKLFPKLSELYGGLGGNRLVLPAVRPVGGLSRAMRLDVAKGKANPGALGLALKNGMLPDAKGISRHNIHGPPRQADIVLDILP